MLGGSCLGTSEQLIFLKAADLIAGPYRAKDQRSNDAWRSPRNIYQAEIDAACEFIDFPCDSTPHFLQEIQAVQPESAEGIWNRMEYRGLEGFVFAITPFQLSLPSREICARRRL